MGRNNEVQREIPRSASIDISGDKEVVFSFRAKDPSVREDADFVNFVSHLVQEINSHYQSYLNEDKVAKDPYFTARVPHGVQILYALVNKVSGDVKFTDMSSEDQLSYLDQTVTRYKIGKELTFFQRLWPFSTEGRRHPETQAFYENLKSEILNLKNYYSIHKFTNDFTEELSEFAKQADSVFSSLRKQSNIIETHMNWGKSFARIVIELEREKHLNAINALKPIIQTAEDYVNEELFQSATRLRQFVKLIQLGMEKNSSLRHKKALMFELSSYFSLFKRLESFKFYLYYYLAYERPAESVINPIKDLMSSLDELENSICQDMEVVIAGDGCNPKSSTLTIWLRLQSKLSVNSELKSNQNLLEELNAIENQLNKISNDYQLEMAMQELYTSLYNTKFRSLIAPALEEYVKLCQNILSIEVRPNPNKKHWPEMSRIEKKQVLIGLVERDHLKKQGFFLPKPISPASSGSQNEKSREVLVRENFLEPRQEWAYERVRNIIRQDP